MAGFTTVVAPASLTLNPGETKSFTVTITRTTATVNVYTGGQLTWSDGTHSVRIPLVVRPVALAAPARCRVPVVRSTTTSRSGTTGRSRPPLAVSSRRSSRPARSRTTRPTARARSTSPNAQIITVAIPAGHDARPVPAVRRGCQCRLGHRPVRVQRAARTERRRYERQRYVRRAGQPAQPGGRRLHASSSRVGASPDRRRSSCTRG